MQYAFVACLLVASVTALPLNINLGAYSPALVVGDGEISFGGKADVSNLMNALEGAAANGAAAAAPAAAAPKGTAPAAGAAGGATTTPATAAPAGGKEGVVNAAAVAPDAQVTSLQGMGKEIAPRVVPLQRIDNKRDLSGFNAALKYASDAIKSSPTVQLGTGEGGSGVGILQSAGGNISGGAPKAGAGKREAPRMKTTVTTMFIRGGSITGDVASNKVARSEAAPIVQRNPSPGLSGVNLNMAAGQVAELTFVETRAVDDDAEDKE